MHGKMELKEKFLLVQEKLKAIHERVCRISVKKMHVMKKMCRTLNNFNAEMNF